MFVQQENSVMERKIILIFYAAHSDCLVQHIFIMKKENKKKLIFLDKRILISHEEVGMQNFTFL